MLTEAIVLAGGFGTRLRSVVSDMPKPLAPVAGRPFLAWLLDALAAGGLRRVVLATGYLGDLIQAAIGDGHAGMEIAYVRENEPLGTGGAIAHALPRLTASRLLVLNGDTYVRVPYQAMAAAMAGHAVAMAVHAVPDRARYGTVLVQDGVARGFAEKQAGASGPGRINTGVYLIDRTLPALQRVGAFSFERDILETMPGRIGAYDVPGPFIDIGTPDDFARAQTLLPAWAML